MAIHGTIYLKMRMLKDVFIILYLVEQGTVPRFMKTDHMDSPYIFILLHFAIMIAKHNTCVKQTIVYLKRPSSGFVSRKHRHHAAMPGPFRVPRSVKVTAEPTICQFGSLPKKAEKYPKLLKTVTKKNSLNRGEPRNRSYFVSGTRNRPPSHSTITSLASPVIP